LALDGRRTGSEDVGVEADGVTEVRNFETDLELTTYWR
jgi:hypothetical protein